MRISFTNKHVLITGGSEGIGLALAHQFLSDGASVTLLARSLGKLQSARSVLEVAFPGGTVHVISADVSNAKALNAALQRIEDDFGVIDVAVCNAGLSIPKLIVDQTLEEAERVMQVNYMGCYYTAHALLPGMIARRAGHICFISSMVYVSPMAGYTSYSPTKAAVRHLADCLRSELTGTGVTVSVGYPPDTQTPGFEVENETKSGVTHAIMEHEGEVVHTPAAVAACLFRGLRRGAYHLPTPSLLHSLALSLVAGLTPRPRWLLLEALLAPILVIVGWVTYVQQDAVVRKWRAAQPRQAEAPSEAPADAPAEAPAEALTDVPAEAPSEVRSEVPMVLQAEAPAEALTDVPAEAPSEVRSEVPMVLQAEAPAEALTDVPAEAPSEVPSEVQMVLPAEAPAELPAKVPAVVPAEESAEAPAVAPVGGPAQVLVEELGENLVGSPAKAPVAVPKDLLPVAPAEAAGASSTAE